MAQLESFPLVSPPQFATTAATSAPLATGHSLSGAGAGPAWELQPQQPADLPRAPLGITVVGGAPAVGAASGFATRVVARAPRADTRIIRRRGPGIGQTAGLRLKLGQ